MMRADWLASGIVCGARGEGSDSFPEYTATCCG